MEPLVLIEWVTRRFLTVSLADGATRARPVVEKETNRMIATIILMFLIEVCTA